MTYWLLFTLFIITVLLTLAIRTYAHHKELLDHPNNRSSHTVATPKGGGLAIMLTFYTALSYLYLQNSVEASLYFALLSALPVVIISLIDDIYPLPAKVRFGVQLVSAISAVYFLGGISLLNLSSFSLSGSWINIIAVLTIVWMTNLYNFLDGIDGYAGSEAVFVGLAAYLLFGNDTALLIAVATIGFLLFNWHKASIFMGDVGSAPLGFIFAVLILNDASNPNFLSWLMLLSLFWFDATLTLIHRAKQKEKLSQAHKNHAYQRLNQAGFTHDRVVMLAMSVNLVIFDALYLLPQESNLYLFLALMVVLYLLTKFIDTKKAFT